MSLTLYTKNNCAYCVQAKTLLKNINVDFSEVNIETDVDARNFVINEGHRTMPQIYLDGKLFVEGGFSGLKSLGNEGIKQKLSPSINIESLGTL
jgi:glutaredoxin